MAVEEQSLESTEYDQSLETEPTQQEQPSVYDLDSAEKVRFQGREWTPKELREAYLLRSDYTKKTQALAEERKFVDNLATDLENVIKRPELASEFMKIYPKKYHSVLNHFLKEQNQGVAQTQQPKQEQVKSPQVDPEFMTRFERVEQQLIEKQTQAINAELDAKFKMYNEKYPASDEESVVARAVYLSDSGHELSDKTWDALFKASHERNMGLSVEQTKKQVTKQRELNSQGKDSASGGGLPGQAPRRPKTLKEATQFALDEINAS